MEITYKTRECIFEKVHTGQGFMFDGQLFIRIRTIKVNDIKCYHAVNLETGEPREMNYADKVSLCDVTVEVR